MKKTALLFALITLVTISNAQITLEHNYPASTSMIGLSLSGYKYFMMDVVNNQCRIYNLDHSAWKTINLNVPSGMYLYDIKYVSEKLFNTDSKVELAYVYYSYDTTLLYYTYYTKIISEDGALLLSIPGCAFVDVKAAGSGGSKLLAYVYDYSIVQWTLNTMVYALPGNLFAEEEMSEIAGANRFPYPNPASTHITIPYRLPAGTGNGLLQIMNASGQPIKTFRLSPDFHEFSVPVNDLPVGGYFYRVMSSGGVVGSGGFVHD